MFIAVDAMGSDFGPATIISGVAQALEDFPDLNVVLVGDLERIRTISTRLGIASHPRVQFEHASEVVDMSDLSTTALRSKKNSSIAVCAELVRQGRVKGIFSAGHTGASVAVSTIRVRTQPGIDRPAIASLMPGVGGHYVMIDAGANTDCKPMHLAQFAIMGEAYARAALHIKNPRIGLISVGDEDCKGNELTKETFKILAKMPINFVGNVEGHSLFCHQKADVVVCDGFTGNVVLKASESLAEATFYWMKEIFMRNPYRMVLGHAARPAFSELKAIANYEEFGGAPLLGLNSVCIIGHGASSPKAVRNGLRVALDFIKEDINTKILDRITESGVLMQTETKS